MFNQTKLSPLEEVLFQTWARAHGVQNQDDPNNSFDYRGHYRQTGGAMMHPHVLMSMSQAHNAANEPDEAGGDMSFPDPYMAQAEMHKANLDAQGKDKANQSKLEIEKMKMQHTSQEKEKDRAHKMQMEQMKQAQRAQEQQQQMHARAQEAEANRQARAQEAEAMRQHGMKTAVMQEGFERSRPQPDPMSGMAGQPQPSPSMTAGGDHVNDGGGLHQQLMQRQLSNGGDIG